MALATFLDHCKTTYAQSARIFLTDNVSTDVLRPVLVRLETLERSLRWAGGRILHINDADELLPLVSEFIQLVQTALSTEEGTFGYQAPLVQASDFGRSSYCITEEQLRFLLSCGFTASQIAEVLDVSVRTVKRRLREIGRLCSF